MRGHAVGVSRLSRGALRRRAPAGRTLRVRDGGARWMRCARLGGPRGADRGAPVRGTSEPLPSAERRRRDRAPSSSAARRQRWGVELAGGSSASAARVFSHPRRMRSRTRGWSSEPLRTTGTPELGRRPSAPRPWRRSASGTTAWWRTRERPRTAGGARRRWPRPSLAAAIARRSRAWPAARLLARWWRRVRATRRAAAGCGCARPRPDVALDRADPRRCRDDRR